MRRSVLVVAVALIALVSAVGAAAGHSRPSPRLYLDHALALMRANAVVTPAKGWPSVMQKATRMAAHAKSPGGTYGALSFAIDQLYQAGDVHARFANPLMAKLAAQTAKQTGRTWTPAPTVSLLDGKIGVITVPGVASSPVSPNSRHYVASALAALSSLEVRSAPCGWIVDLRRDTGGDMYPMLFSLGPLLGNGPLIGFTGTSGFFYNVSYRDGVLSGGGHTFTAPMLVPTFGPAPPVAVLTGPATLSSGEAVAIAFHGRADTRSFGAATGGAPTSPQTYRLSDGATITFSIADDIDRNGVVYKEAIPPDEPVADDLPDGAAEAAAEQWLLATPACSAVGG
jgi:carboxyl-terminal processing protease